MKGGLALLAVIAALSAQACNLINPIERDEDEAGVDIQVVGCDYDPQTGVATATFELTSDQEYATILLQGEVSDESGVVLATTTSSVAGVDPGTTYRHEMVFGGLSSEPQGRLTCDVTFDFANPGF